MNQDDVDQSPTEKDETARTSLPTQPTPRRSRASGWLWLVATLALACSLYDLTILHRQVLPALTDHPKPTQSTQLTESSTIATVHHATEGPHPLKNNLDSHIKSSPQTNNHHELSQTLQPLRPYADSNKSNWQTSWTIVKRLNRAWNIENNVAAAQNQCRFYQTMVNHQGKKSQWDHLLEEACKTIMQQSTQQEIADRLLTLTTGLVVTNANHHPNQIGQENKTDDDSWQQKIISTIQHLITIEKSNAETVTQDQWHQECLTLILAWQAQDNEIFQSIIQKISAWHTQGAAELNTSAESALHALSQTSVTAPSLDFNPILSAISDSTHPGIANHDGIIDGNNKAVSIPPNTTKQLATTPSSPPTNLPKTMNDKTPNTTAQLPSSPQTSSTQPPKPPVTTET